MMSYLYDLILTLGIFTSTHPTNNTLYCLIVALFYKMLYNNKINARVLIGQSTMVYCAGKPMEKSRVFWIII